LASVSLVDNILNGKEKITLELAQKLGEFFHVEAGLFYE
jgi:HTH-type transcriptional regulator / antitoxin HigA